MTYGQLRVGEAVNLMVDDDGRVQLHHPPNKSYTVVGYVDNGTVLEDDQKNLLTLDHQRLELRPRQNTQTKDKDMNPIPIADLAGYKDGVAVPAVEGILTKLYDAKRQPEDQPAGQYGRWCLQGGILTDDNQNQIAITFADEQSVQPKEMWNKRIHIEAKVGQKGSSGIKMKADKKTKELGLWITGSAIITYPDGKPAPREQAPAASKPANAPQSTHGTPQPRGTAHTPQHPSTVSERVGLYFGILALVEKGYNDSSIGIELTTGDLKDIATHISMTYKGDYGAYAPPVFDGPTAEALKATGETPSTEEAPELPAVDWESIAHPLKGDKLGECNEAQQKKYAAWAFGVTPEKQAAENPQTRDFRLGCLAMAAAKKWGPAYLTGCWLHEASLPSAAFETWCQQKFGCTQDELMEENCIYILGNQKRTKDEVEKLSAEDTGEELPD